jgi:eukaryotic-like serine/threonine-protein kinase
MVHGGDKGSSMSLLKRFRIKNAIRLVLADDGASGTGKSPAITALKQFGTAAVPSLIQALAQGQARQTLVDLLAAAIDNSALPLCCQALRSDKPTIVRGVVQALSQGKRFDPNQLLPFFTEAKIPKTELVTILTAHKHTLRMQNILELLNTADKASHAAIFRLIDQVANESMVADIIPYTAHHEWLVRLHLARILSRFSTEAVRDTLLRLLADAHKDVRQAALAGLAGLRLPCDIGPICQLLRDPDLTVQSKAIETLIQINNPQAIHPLLDILQDESEYVRRAAVEVLNVIGNTNAIKDLLSVLRDKDWWVRVRAADALGNIGGPRVIEAVLPLMKDEDAFIRRCAIEILNTKQDPQMVEPLLEALADPDWWVRERAIDALIPFGDARAFPAFVRLVQQETESTPAAIRALVSLGDERGVEALVPKLRSLNKGIVKEALRGLAKLTSATHAGMVQEALAPLLHVGDTEICELATQAFNSLVSRYGARSAPVAAAVAGAPTLGVPGRMASKESTLILTPSAAGEGEPPSRLAGSDAAAHIKAPQQAIDPTTIEENTVIAERYRMIRQVGKGAFGIVVLVEDMVVHEEIILKFLNPYLAASEGIIKRFIHELRYARKITHENVIRIYDFLTIGHSFAISMEYFRSHALAVEMEAMKTDILPRKFEILRDICKGMSVAHQADIVHRDLKPQNILINDDGLVKIVDFGLAAAISHPDSRLTASGTLMGTPAYMAPEQIRGGDIDRRTDIYSLGVIMYEMFTGRPPYVGKDPMSVLYQHMEGKAVPPRQRIASISQSLDVVIRRAMAVDPAKRYQTVDALRAHIEKLLITQEKAYGTP